MERSYVEGHVHAKDLKAGLANHINEMLEPVRRHFNSSPERKDLLKKVQQKLKKIEQKPREYYMLVQIIFEFIQQLLNHGRKNQY